MSLDTTVAVFSTLRYIIKLIEFNNIDILYNYLSNCLTFSFKGIKAIEKIKLIQMCGRQMQEAI